MSDPNKSAKLVGWLNNQANPLERATFFQAQSSKTPGRVWNDPGMGAPKYNFVEYKDGKRIN